MTNIYNHVADHTQHPIIVKLKDNFYMACFQWIKLCSILHIIEEALKKNILKEGDTVIDSSSGTYAYSLMLACHKYKLKCIIVGSSAINNELKTMIEILGGIVYIIDNGVYSQQARVDFVKEILNKHKNYFWTEQYNNKDHYIGYNILAKQLLNLFPNKKINLIAGVGTGASSIGVYLYLKQQKQDINLIAIDTFGSISFGSENLKDNSTQSAVGIGSNMPFKTLDQSLYTTTHWLSVDLMKYFTIQLYKEHAIFAGLTSGATYGVGGFESNKSKDNNEIFISLSGDMGYRYFDSVYKDYKDYNKKNNILPKEILDKKQLQLPWSYKIN
jgi:cysteine synthase